LRWTHEAQSHQQVQDRLGVGLLQRRDIDRLGVVTKPVSEVDSLEGDQSNRRKVGELVSSSPPLLSKLRISSSP